MRTKTKRQTTSVAAVALLHLAASWAVSWAAAADEDPSSQVGLGLSAGGASLEGAAAIAQVYGGYSVDVVVVQGNTYNFVDQADVTNISRIDGSFNGNSGIAQVNQSTGILDNQANVVAIAIGGSAEGGFGHLSATVDVIYVGNKVIVKDAVLGSHISDSFNNMSGIAQVNQSSGGLNSQHNVVAVGVGASGTGDFVALSDSALAEHSGGNEIMIEGDFEADNSVTNSFNNYSGIAQVNQVAGYGNTTAQTVAVTVNTINVP